MSFHSPGSWLLIALAIPIVILYLWNFASRRHEVATFPLWQQALARRPTWLALRSHISLAAQLIILLFLVAALAQPYWTEIFASRRNVVLVLDVSASMSATDVQPSRFEAMQKEAERIVGELNRGERMAVISAGSPGRIVHRFAEEPETLLTAVQTIKPTDGTSRIVVAVQLARRMLDEKTNPNIILLTDGAFAGAGELAGAEDVKMVLFGETGANAAITKLEARPDPVQPEQYHVLVEAANYSERDIECPLEVGLADSDPQTVTLTLTAGESAQQVLTCTVGQTGLLTANLKFDDDLAADNVAHVLVQGLTRPTVTLVSDDAATPKPEFQAIKDAFEADPYVDAQVASEPVTDTLTVLFGEIPEQLPSGPLLVVQPEGCCDLWNEAGVPDNASFAVKSVRAASPLLTGVDFAGVVVKQATRLDFKADVPVQSLVESATGDPLYSAIDRPEGRIAVLHVHLDTDNSDLTLRPDFPTLIANAIRWLTPAPEMRQASATTDEVVSLASSDSSRRVTMKKGDFEKEIAAGQTVTLLERAGVWNDPSGQAGDSDNSPFVLACNMANPSESDLRIREDAQSDALTPIEPTSDQPLWILLVGIAILLISVEWCLFHRRVVV